MLVFLSHVLLFPVQQAWCFACLKNSEKLLGVRNWQFRMLKQHLADIHQWTKRLKFRKGDLK